MKILITGATGFLGKPLTQQLLDEGHTVVAAARHPEHLPHHPRLIRLRWDATREVPSPDPLRDVEAVVHLAGASIGRLPWTPSHRKAIWISRVEGTHRLALALQTADAPVRVVAAASAIGYYGDRGDEPLTETSPPGSGYLAQVVQAWEDAVTALCGPHTHCVRLRFDMVLGREGGAFPRLKRAFLAGGVILGSPSIWWSWIHAVDARRLLILALNGTLPAGVYNAVAPEPVQQRTFVRALARRLRRPVWGRIPAGLLRVVLGDAASLFLWSQRVLPHRLQEVSYRWRFPAPPNTLDDLLGK
ncbi:MAG: TIGR01777 family oxidoreductase [Candidatus Hydrothermae bacterium]|nr:TIGR01777 family oxidoreductase [Candidatus Hydrothermae bacterium]